MKAQPLKDREATGEVSTQGEGEVSLATQAFQAVGST